MSALLLVFELPVATPPKKIYWSRHLGHAPARHFLDGETGKAAEEEGRGRVAKACVMCGYGVDRMCVEILLHLEDAVTSATDDIEIAIIRPGVCGRVYHVLASEKQKRKKVEKPTFEDGLIVSAIISSSSLIAGRVSRLRVDKLKGGVPEHPLFRNKPHSGVTNTNPQYQTSFFPSILFRFSLSFLHFEALSMAKQYTEEDIRHAYAEAVRTNNLRASARNWAIPPTSLHRRLNGALPHSVAHQNYQRLSVT